MKNEKAIDLRAIAARTLKDHPKVEKVIVTTDGHAFLPPAKGLAMDHARKQSGECFEFTRDELTAEKVETGKKPKPSENEREKKEKEAAAKKAKDKDVAAEKAKKDDAEAEMKAAEEKQAAEEAAKKESEQEEPVTILGRTKSEWLAATVKEMGEFVAEETQAVELQKLIDLEWIDTKGGKDHVTTRIEALGA